MNQNGWVVESKEILNVTSFANLKDRNVAQIKKLINVIQQPSAENNWAAESRKMLLQMPIKRLYAM